MGTIFKNGVSYSGGGGSGTGDMLQADYDSDSTVKNGGGIKAWVQTWVQSLGYITGLAWSALTGKPFDDVGYGLKVTSGTLEAKIGSVTLRNYEDTQQGFCQLWVNQQDAGIITGTRFLQLMQVLSTAGDTTYTFTSSLLNAGSVIDVYTNIYGVNPTNVVTTNGQCVVTFPKQSSAELMTCRIYIK